MSDTSSFSALESMGCEDFLVHGRVSMLIFCLTYALFFNKIGYPCRGEVCPLATREY